MGESNGCQGSLPREHVRLARRLSNPQYQGN